MLAESLRSLLGKVIITVGIAGLVIATAPIHTADAAAAGDNQTYFTVGVDEGGKTPPPPRKTPPPPTGGAGDDDG